MKIRTIGIIMAAMMATNAQGSCDDIYKLAESMMKARQKGAELPKILDVIERNGSSDAVKKLAIMAYKEPRWNNENLQKRAISEFANKFMLECLK